MTSVLEVGYEYWRPADRLIDYSTDSHFWKISNGRSEFPIRFV